MNMLTKNVWFLFFLLLASPRATSSAADPALNSKLVLHDSAESLEKSKIQQVLRLDDVHRISTSYKKTENSPAIEFQLGAIRQPTLPAILLPSTHRYQNQSLIRSLYYNLPQMAKKYSPKLKEWIPYVKRNENALSRAWQNVPVVRQMAASSRSLDIKAAIGFLLFIPLLICCSAFFFNVIALGAGVIGYNYYDLSTLGRRSFEKRSTREWFAIVDFNKLDLNKIFSFDRFLPPDQPRTLVTIATNVEKALRNYKRSLKSDTPTYYASRSYLAGPAG
jgi:hypothetical protein